MKKIMLVDDSMMMRAILKNFITKMGLEVQFIEASDGLIATEKYQTEKPDLIFMDLMMPNMDGLTAARKIREYDSQSKIIMCTSVKEAAQAKEAQVIGIKEYITKPFTSQEIIEVVKKHLI